MRLLSIKNFSLSSSIFPKGIPLYLFISFITIIGCDSPFAWGEDNNDLKVDSFWIQPGSTKIAVNLKCSAESDAYAYAVGSSNSQISISLSQAKAHYLPIQDLTPDSNYTLVFGCGKISDSNPTRIPFTTWVSDQPIVSRGIYLVGGVDGNGYPIAEVDLFDPVESKWYPAFTSVPTPRSFALTIYHKGKIFVMGGAKRASGGSWTVTDEVEAFDPFTKTWTSFSPMPATLHGAIGGSSGDEIYAIAGSTSLNTTSGTLLNTVYRFYPEIGLTGTWASPFTSQTSIFPKIDMSSCVFDGTFYFTGGRQYNDGSASATSDSYIPSLNATSAITESSLITARHGAAIACYRPQTGDPSPGASKYVLIAGGSSGSNFFQPVTSVSPVSNYEVYAISTTTNAYATGPSLLQALYFPAMEISYDINQAYVFGGASTINVPTDFVYSIGLSNPTAGPWTLSAQKMPRARYGHKAVILR
ncbi:hypothetical protein V6Z05_00465 [Leptospira venezuelensis]|uniref:Kelch repeat-containing protein n=1 Tax=Leptospira venezuelensis TaxID=1958811 RepID=UPI000A38AFF4|nr:hypothetical protein [Leptospira venezuelensis]